MGLVIKASVIKKYLRNILLHGDTDMLTEAMELLKDHTGAQYTLVTDGKITYTTVTNADHLLHLRKQVKKGVSDYMQYTPFLKTYRLIYPQEFAVLLVEQERSFSLDKELLESFTLIARIATYREHIMTAYLTDKYTRLPNRDAVFSSLERKPYSTLAYIKICNRRELVSNTNLEYYDKMISVASEVLKGLQSNVYRTSVDSFAYLLQSDTDASFLFMQDALEQVEEQTELELSACITPVGNDLHFALYLCESYQFNVPKDICILRDVQG